MEQNEKWHGGCLCGAVRYEATSPPFRSGYCHCRTCQRSLGNAFGAAAFFRHEIFRFVTGEPRWYQSSAFVRRGFCALCGSPIAYQHSDNQHIAIWIGTLDQPNNVLPEVHWYWEERIVWAKVDPNLPDATTELAAHRRALRQEG